ncbi:LysR family transcriptional regulator [Citrobacter sp. Awk 4]|uniref:LysR family transcriptional regulator n=1 Tax=Citrobacter sp. Awk 4 TaxID=2963955 RepID=UPI0023040944|nr:LysR family transcriptional regulator [Citrobacter sp. Awk 4]MDA8480982.1 LysR family transcriptional regulator [Citrobacter sp. Awk 4]
MTFSTYPEKSIGYLYEVGVHGGIRRAADALGINPSVVSRQLSELERTLQLPLLERRGRNVVLTDVGKLLAEDYALTAQRRKQLERQLQDLRHMRGGTVNLRIGQGMVEEVVRHVISEFSLAYPAVFVNIQSGDMQTTLTLLAKGEVDMSVSFGPSTPADLKCNSFRRGPICAIVPPEHPVASLSAVTAEELTRHRLIVMSEDFGIQRYLNAIFKNEGLIFTPAYRCNLFTSAIALCQTGQGVAFMTPQTLKNIQSREQLVAVPVDHRIARESLCHLLRCSDHRMTPAANYLWHLLNRYFAGLP